MISDRIKYLFQHAFDIGEIITLRVCTELRNVAPVLYMGGALCRVEVAACLLVSLPGHDTLHLGFILTASAPDWKMTGAVDTHTHTTARAVLSRYLLSGTVERRTHQTYFYCLSSFSALFIH